MKFQVDLLADELARKLGQVGFDIAVFTSEGGAGAQIDGGEMGSSIGQDGAACVDTVGRQALIFGGEVRCGKSKMVASAFTSFDFTKNGKRATQHSGGVGEFS